MTYMVELDLYENSVTDNSVLVNIEFPVVPQIGMAVLVDMLHGKDNMVDGEYRITDVSITVCRDKHPMGQFGHRAGFWCKALKVT